MAERLERSIVASIEAGARPERADAERAYLKSDLTHLGVAVPVVRSIVRAELRRLPEPLDHDSAVALASGLWSEPVHERRLAAMEVLVTRRAVLSAGDLPLLERLLREAHTWALVDPLAITVVGDLVLHVPDEPRLVSTLDRWAVDDDFWMRRSALLSQLQLLRRERTAAEGAADFARFAGWADALLDDREFFVRKAIGWVLREIATRDPALVVAYVAPRTDRMSGVTWREAVRRLPPADAATLQARRTKRPAHP